MKFLALDLPAVERNQCHVSRLTLPWDYFTLARHPSANRQQATNGTFQ